MLRILGIELYCFWYGEEYPIRNDCWGWTSCRYGYMEIIHTLPQLLRMSSTLSVKYKETVCVFTCEFF